MRASSRCTRSSRRSARRADDHDDLRRAGAAPRLRARRSPKAATSAAGSSTCTRRSRDALADIDVAAPAFDEFWAQGSLAVPETDADTRAARASAPTRRRIRCNTPSGRIELFSETIEGFGYDDCPGHPAWLETDRVARRAEGRALPAGSDCEPAGHAAAQPARRGAVQPGDEGRRARARADASRGRGGARHRRRRRGAAVQRSRQRAWPARCVDERLRPGVVQLSTGAWFDPDDPSRRHAMCVHGNPNVLTRDIGTSRLSQGCSGQHALVEVERFDAAVPPVSAFEPPTIDGRDSSPQNLSAIAPPHTASGMTS